MNKNTIPEQHFMLYKPFGILSQLTSGEEKQILKKRFLSELYDFPSGTMPVGRLDEKSEGLLLMTTNGKLSNYINTLGIEKEYYAQLDGEITQEAIDNIKMGVSIGVFGKIYQTKPCFALKLMHVPQFPQASKRHNLFELFLKGCPARKARKKPTTPSQPHGKLSYAVGSPAKSANKAWNWEVRFQTWEIGRGNYAVPTARSSRHLPSFLILLGAAAGHAWIFTVRGDNS